MNHQSDLTTDLPDLPIFGLSLPTNLEAEKSFLGAVFVVGDRVIDHAASFLRPEHFAEETHGAIWERCYEMAAENKIPNPVTLKGFMAETEGGAAYLAHLASYAVTETNAKEYAWLIRDLWLRRQLIGLCADINSQCVGGESNDAAQIVETLESELALLDVDSGSQKGLMPVYSFVTETLQNIRDARDSNGVVGLSYGLTDLDKKTGGMFNGDLIFVAGRPGMGKSALALSIAWANALDKKTVAFFSLEMTEPQLLIRLFSIETKISATDIRRGTLTDEQLEQIESSAENIKSVPLSIDGQGGISLAHIRHRARHLKRKGGLNLMVVDYLGLMQTAERYRGQRVTEIGQLTRGLKSLAKELDVPIIVLCQLSRAVESRDDKRPKLSDLRESGDIEQDADVVLFVYREVYYIDAAGEPLQIDADIMDHLDRVEAWKTKRAAVAGKADLHVAKQRNGPTGVVKTFFDEKCMWFGDLQQGEFNDL